MQRRRADGAPAHRVPLDRGPGLLPGRPLPACSATSPTTGSCAGTRPPARSACSASPAGYANGHTVDRQGRLVSCEHGTRRVTRTEHDGSVTVLADRYDGKRLNSPNDIVERADGSLWFTDPSYGIDSDYEGHRADSEIGACHVYRLDPAAGRPAGRRRRLRRAPTGWRSPRTSGSSTSSTAGRSTSGVFDVTGDRGASPAARSSPPATRARSTGSGSTTRGRIWAAAADGLHCFDPDGTLIGKLHVPEVVANFTFGGRSATSCSCALDLAVLDPGQLQRRPLPRIKAVGPRARPAAQ